MSLLLLTNLLLTACRKDENEIKRAHEWLIFVAKNRTDQHERFLPLPVRVFEVGHFETLVLQLGRQRGEVDAVVDRTAPGKSVNIR